MLQIIVSDHINKLSLSLSVSLSVCHVPMFCMIAIFKKNEAILRQVTKMETEGITISSAIIYTAHFVMLQWP